jgi:hypothetical protein
MSGSCDSSSSRRYSGRSLDGPNEIAGASRDADEFHGDEVKHEVGAGCSHAA